MGDMTRYVALLRGINLGARRPVAMADLRTLVTRLGYTDVATHLRSGNVVLTAPGADADEVAARVRGALRRELDLDVPTVVRAADRLRAAVDANPLDVPDPARFLVLFCSGHLDVDALRGLDPSRLPDERLAVTETEAYTDHREGLRRARAPVLVARHADGVLTGRNWRTVLRLLRMVEG
ncbi:hypothetical protein BJF83_08495 [Nocardiopsis sp. CNR-923]|uniref:DUF1697 domain-containing protein n=1 Tax=Nocardiopsis sp. CNR-923 TaxID=1904965 RepID=UPI00095AD453|nr:DUF1697 domain-containing protein [Nocardiopsis sp. CNR-923]OLT30336.1 hypothetical protein BJF83_08495 [Nocardiopsis sp. CNR-923]